MKKQIIHSIVIVSILLFLIQGCAYTVSQIQTKEGTVKVGMSKDEVLAIWGKPYHKWLREQSLDSDEWIYPGKHWWGANQITLWFDEKGLVKEIELVQD